jgi:hypothetical protein
MATKIVDRRDGEKRKTFKELERGEFFYDCDGDLCIKADKGYKMWHDGVSWFFTTADEDDTVRPIDVTVTIEG